MSRPSSRRDRASREGGYSIVEAAITLPVIILLSMVVVQYALLWHGRHVAEAAAREGLEAARGYQSTAGAGQSAVTSYLNDVAPQLIQAPQVTVSRSATTVTVQIHAHVLRIVPAGDYTVDETASGPVERFVALGAGPTISATNSPVGFGSVAVKRL